MTFECGSARPLYERNAHPRLLLGPADLSSLRKRIRSGHGRAIMTRLRRKVAPWVAALDKPNNAADVIRRWGICAGENLLGANIMLGLDDMAMVALLDEEEHALDAVRRVFRAIPELDRTKEVGMLALGVSMLWNTPLAFDLIAPHLPPADRAAFVSWMIENRVRKPLARHRASYLRSSGANTPLAEIVCTALLSVLAMQGEPGAEPLHAERDELITFLKASLHTAFGPQGYPSEDTGYGTSVLAALAYSVEAARRAGLYDAYEDCPRFAAAGRALLHIVQPWGKHLSNTGDYVAMFPNRNFVLARLASETKDRLLLWLLSTLSYPADLHFCKPDVEDDSTEVPLTPTLRVGTDSYALLVLDDLAPPVSPDRGKVATNFVDRGRGLVSFRSGWKPDDTLVIFDGSQRTPSAQGHAHDSCGHFTISALGEYFAIDTGRYSIGQDQHNVVLVDGKPGRSTDGGWRASYYHGLLTACEPGAFCDFAAVDSSHQHNCYWARRSLGFVKGAHPYIWTVEDINKANDWAEFWWTLNTHYNNRIETQTDHAVIHGCRYGHRLEVHFALPAPDAYPKPHTLTIGRDVGRCSSHKYVGDIETAAEKCRDSKGDYAPEQAVLVRPRLLANVAGYNGRFMSLMIPRRKNEPPATVERLPSLDNSLAVRIKFPDVTDTLVWAYEHNLLEAGDVKARGQWVVVRRSLRTGRVIARASL